MSDEKLYEMMRDLGDARIKENFYRLRNQGHLSKTRLGSALVGKAAFNVLDKLTKYAARKPTKPNARRVLQLLREIRVQPALAVTLQTMVDRVSVGISNANPITITGLRTIVGHALKNEMEFAYLARLDPDRYGYARRQLNDPSISAISKQGTKKYLLKVSNDVHEVPAWDRADCYLIGSLLCDFVMKFSGLFIQETVWLPKNFDCRHRARPKHIVKFTEAVSEWIEEGVEALADLKPINLPISTPPLDWGPGLVGGYDQQERRLPGIITARTNHHQSAFDKSDCPEVYEAINTIQRTAWRVNRAVYDVLKVAIDNQWPDINVDLHPGNPPAKPVIEFTPNCPAWRAYSRKKTEYYHLELRWRRSRLRVARGMSVAEVLKDIDRLYYPHQLDFRTRCYPVGGPLQYQGPDLQRGMLEFADGKRIDSAEARSWFFIHGANCWGEDKVPFYDRIAWVDKNWNRILQCGEDPIDNRWWTEADEPVQFLAWCIDAYNWDRDPDNHKSHLPISMDGSNNGLQIYSLLLRDEVGGKATNCAPSESPQDIYGEVATRLTETLRGLAASGEALERRRAKQVLRFCEMQGLSGVPRDAVKRPVMTLPYGATIYSCQHYLCDWYHDYVRGKDLDPEDAPFPEGDSYKIWTWVGNLTWDAIGEVVVKARECMDWLRDAANEMSSAGKNIYWTTPLGVRCVQRYTRGKLKNLSLKAGGMLKLQVWEDDGNPHPSRSANGFCPNYIHSLDASAMMRTVNLAVHRGVTHFMMIHDSFGTHAADAPAMAESLREAYTQIFSEDRLSILRDELQAQLGNDLRALPSYGNLEISDLQNSEYFFA